MSSFSTLSSELQTIVTQAFRARALGVPTTATSIQGGIQSRTLRISAANGSAILKTHDAAPADWYPIEAEGLSALRRPGCPRVPDVYSVASSHLLLEDLGEDANKLAGAPDVYWQSFGRQLATLHTHTAALHGYPHDNYLGVMPQQNTQHADGIDFFIQCRVLRYLSEPIAEQTLTREDRQGVERLCDRMRREFPKQPASFCHGDLWTGNMLIGPNNEPAHVDPAIHYGPAEAELSLTRHFGGVPESFYNAYEEVRPLDSGWRERMPFYELKEMLGLISQFADEHNMVAPLRSLVARFG